MSDKCPKCGMEEVSALHPRTLYACGSSDFDRSPGTFWQSHGCKRIEELTGEIERISEMTFNYAKRIEDLEIENRRSLIILEMARTAINEDQWPGAHSQVCEQIARLSEGDADDNHGC